MPLADQGLNKIPDTVTDRQALLVGDVLATGYWAAKISEITHTYPLSKINEAYELFEKKRDGVIKVAVEC